jgi:hypothetical protein
MVNIKSLYSKLLKEYKVTSKDLRKRKFLDTKKSILDQLIAVTRTEKKTREQTLKYIRSELKEDQFKFSNELGRDLFDAQSKREYRGKSGTQSRRSYRPNIKKIPVVRFKHVDDGWFMYAARVYCSNSKRQKNKKPYPFKKLPRNKNIIKIYSQASRYQTIEDFSFWSPLLLTRGEVEQMFKDILSGNKKINSIANIEGSSRMDIDFSVIIPIAFKYDRVIRNEYS